MLPANIMNCRYCKSVCTENPYDVGDGDCCDKCMWGNNRDED